MRERDALAVRVNLWLASLSHGAAIVSIFSGIGDLRGERSTVAGG
jgi:hypothetical protein